MFFGDACRLRLVYEKGYDDHVDNDCRSFLCCFTGSTSIHFCVIDNVNLSVFCHYFCQAICDCIVQYLVTLCNDVEYSDPCTREITYAKHFL